MNAGKTAATNKVIVHILECIVIFALVMKKLITALKNAEKNPCSLNIRKKIHLNKKKEAKCIVMSTLTTLTIYNR